MAGTRRARGKETTLSQELAGLLGDTVVPSLRKRVEQSEPVRAMLRAALEGERSAGRTADDELAFRERFIEQIGASWILATVFVRFLEDRGWIAQRRIAGPGAEDSEELFGQAFEGLAGDAREYLLAVFRECGRLPGAREVLGPSALAALKLSPDAAAARAIVDFWREVEPFTDERGVAGTRLRWRFDSDDTRVLGDLYQDLSASVRERYALLQTPDFVERFILQYTLAPAMAQRGVEGLRLLDPTCGSGHFLLGAFEMIRGERQRRYPAESAKESAQRALACVHGVDLNPYAVAITRFRLLVAYARAVGLTRLREVERELGLEQRVVVADSLLFGTDPDMLRELVEATPNAAVAEGYGRGHFALEQAQEAAALFATRFDVVVGNPPYIMCKDSAIREEYRKRYPDSTPGKFSLSAPFTSRFFTLAANDGYVGLINANAFMKREFGKGLIETVLPKFDVTHIVDTSGAFIPGHGTPTLILFGRNRPPQSPTVRAVLGKRGEPSTPADPSNGLVWQGIVTLIEKDRGETEFVSVADVERVRFAKHPWSLGGGGATELKDLIEQRCSSRLGDLATAIGFASFPGLDDFFVQPRDALSRNGVPEALIRELIVGEVVRDWSIVPGEAAFTPYSTSDHAAVPLDLQSSWARWAWCWRTTASSVTGFGGKTRGESGENWWEWYRWQQKRYQLRLSITFAEVATHNHFALDRGGRVFKQTAPIIKLAADATEDDHLALLAWLNSSVACFWMKQVSQNKGAGGARGKSNRPRLRFDKWDEFSQFSSTKVESIPVPARSKRADELVVELLSLAERRKPVAQLIREIPGNVRDELATLRLADDVNFNRCVLLQELLDWVWYADLGLLHDDDADAVNAVADRAATAPSIQVKAGLRAFEIRMFEADGLSTWFTKNRYSVPVERNAGVDDETLSHFQQLQMAIIERNPNIALLERPEFKRRWTVRDWDAEVRAACESVILDAIEAQLKDAPEVRPLRELTATLLKSEKMREVLALCFPGDDRPLDRVAELVARDAIPHVAGLRFTALGWEKRQKWEQCWALQRREDAGESVGAIEVPPKYDSKDYRDARYWSLRGRLDVARERFIAYPGATTDDDSSPLYGWAGWNHRERADALAALYQQRKHDSGWGTEKLGPLLASLRQGVTWLQQWHNQREDGEEMGVGDAYAAFVSEEARELGLSEAQLDSWGQGTVVTQPPKKPTTTNVPLVARVALAAHGLEQRAFSLNELLSFAQANSTLRADLLAAAAVAGETVERFFTKMVRAASVAHVPQFIFSEAGWRKYVASGSWPLSELCGEVVPAPERTVFAKKDFAERAEREYWKLRGKDNVPSEYFVEVVDVHRRESDELYLLAAWTPSVRRRAYQDLFAEVDRSSGTTDSMLAILAGEALEYAESCKQSGRPVPASDADFGSDFSARCDALGVSAAMVARWAPRRAARAVKPRRTKQSHG